MPTNSEERMKILKMIEENTITADQGAILLNSIERRVSGEPVASQETPDNPQPEAATSLESIPSAGESAPAKKLHWFRIDVTDSNTGKAKVHVRLPLSLVGWGLKMGSRYTDELSGLDTDELLEALRSGEEGKLVEVHDEEDGEHVVIFIE